MPWNVLAANTLDMAVHAMLLPGGDRGRVLLFGGYDVGDTHFYDVATETVDGTPVGNLPGFNVFCSGHAFLSDGRILVAGGEVDVFDEDGQVPAPPQSMADDMPHAAHGGMGWGGERRCAIFYPLLNQWEEVEPLSLDPAGADNSGGRWYPTCCTLANGKVLIVGGHPDLRENYPNTANIRHSNNIPEVYTPGSDSWKLMASNTNNDDRLTAVNSDWAYDYQRCHLMPDGSVFFTSPIRGKNRFYDAGTGIFLDTKVVDLPSENMYTSIGANYTSVLLPLLAEENYRARILLSNGVQPFRIDTSAADPAWEEADERDWAGTPPRRHFACPVLLPTGEIFFSGGISADGNDAARQANGVHEGEIYTPGIDWNNGTYTAGEGWRTVEASTVTRHYHSVALLLPDGSIWTAGSNGPTEEPHGGTREKRIEMYYPDYYNDPGRPVIDYCPPNVGYGHAFIIRTPQAESIQRVALIRCGSVTHSFNPDQRYVTALFSIRDGSDDELLVSIPNQPAVFPPGRYLVWIIDQDNRPCQLASFLRISRQKMHLSADISTYSIHEVEALGTPAHFHDALFVALDGFLPDEAGLATISVSWRDTGASVPGITATIGAPKFEAGSGEKDTAQRIVYPVRITFTSQAAFDGIPADEDFRDLLFSASLRGFGDNTVLTLSKNPNPRMRDGDPNYLSIDLRVFSTKPEETFTAGIAHGTGQSAPFNYVQSVLQTYNDFQVGIDHPFDALPTDLETNRLALYGEDDAGVPIYNYAIAKVRFRAPEGIDATLVRVFFRLWTTGWSNLQYNTNANYRRHGNGSSATPLLGLIGGEINNVPCFAEEREANMENQSDNTNRRTISGTGATEVTAFFGCYLDMNRPEKRFPLEPSDNGPFNGELLSIQELMRGLHQCLVAEIHYDLDPIAFGATPGSSDNLAQRNILLDESDNPGGFAAHLVHHTFELQPSRYPLFPGNSAVGTTAVAGRLHPDLLVIDWGNLPRESQVIFYIPQADTTEIVRFDALRHGPQNLLAAGSDTLRCKVTDVGFIPVPGDFTRPLASLFSIQLPPGVQNGQEFTVVIRQIDGRSFRVKGAFEFKVYVRLAEVLLPRFRRNLSVLKHIFLAIPQTNRWHPVFERYVSELSDRFRAIGGVPEEVHPSSTGGGRKPSTPGRHDKNRVVTGYVKEILYDCFGKFTGFILQDCDGTYGYLSQLKSLEKTVFRACKAGCQVTVISTKGNKRTVKGIRIHCG